VGGVVGGTMMEDQLTRRFYKRSPELILYYKSETQMIKQSNDKDREIQTSVMGWCAYKRSGR
jgi:hypothetical protein